MSYTFCRRAQTGRSQLCFWKFLMTCASCCRVLNGTYRCSNDLLGLSKVFLSPCNNILCSIKLWCHVCSLSQTETLPILQKMCNNIKDFILRVQADVLGNVFVVHVSHSNTRATREVFWGSANEKLVKLKMQWSGMKCRVCHCGCRWTLCCCGEAISFLLGQLILKINAVIFL